MTANLQETAPVALPLDDASHTDPEGISSAGEQEPEPK